MGITFVFTMETFENWRKKQHLREVLLGHFFAKKTAAESYRLIMEVYGDDAMSKSQSFEWFQRFKRGEFDIKDKERPGQPKKFDDDELKRLLDAGTCETQEQLGKALGVSQAAVSKRLQALGYVQKP